MDSIREMRTEWNRIQWIANFTPICNDAYQMLCECMRVVYVHGPIRVCLRRMGQKVQIPTDSV